MGFIIIIFIALSCQKQNCSETPPIEVVDNTRANLHSVMTGVKDLFNSKGTEVHCLFIRDLFTLSIWQVIPWIDPAARGEEIYNYSIRAQDYGLAITDKVITTVPGVKKYFDSINLMLVDREYNTWYIDFLPVPKENPGIQSHNGARDMEKTEEYYSEYTFIRKRETQNPSFAGWQKVRNELGEILDAESGYPYNTAYLLTEGRSSKIQIYMTIRKLYNNEEIAACVEKLCMKISTLPNIPDFIEVYILSKRNYPVYFGKVRGDTMKESIKAGTIKEDIRLYPMIREYSQDSME